MLSQVAFPHENEDAQSSGPARHEANSLHATCGASGGTASSPMRRTVLGPHLVRRAGARAGGHRNSRGVGPRRNAASPLGRVRSPTREDHRRFTRPDEHRRSPGALRLVGPISWTARTYTTRPRSYAGSRPGLLSPGGGEIRCQRSTTSGGSPGSCGTRAPASGVGGDSTSIRPPRSSSPTSSPWTGSGPGSTGAGSSLRRPGGPGGEIRPCVCWSGSGSGGGT